MLMNNPNFKLDFNERSDNNNPLVNNFPMGDLFWKYPDRKPLETEIARINQLQQDQVFCSNGGDEAIMLLMRLVNQKQKVILPLPAFSQYTQGLVQWNIEVEYIQPKQDLSLDLDKLLQKIKLQNNVVIIITSPNNPTGEYLSIEIIERLLIVSNNQGSWIFLDEAYIEFCDIASASQNLLDLYDNLVILRTFSKAYGLAGIRVGYLIGSKNRIDAFKKMSLPFNVSQPSINIAMEALQQQNRVLVSQYCQQIIQNRKILMEWLSEKNIPYNSSQGNFILINLPPRKSQAVFSFLKRNKILVRTFIDELLKDCIRITIPYNLSPLLSLLKQSIKPALVCLDMDEVLIDTSKSYQQAIKSTVLELSGTEIAASLIEQYKNQTGFNNDWVVTQKILQSLEKHEDLDKVIEVFQSYYLGENTNNHLNGFIKNETAIISKEFINRINNSTDIDFAVVTGRPRYEADLGLELLGLENLASISLNDVEEAKPSPQGIKTLQNKFSKSSWMCGDNPDDILAAVSSNSLAIGIDPSNKKNLYQYGADIVVNSINDIESWL